MGLLIYEQKHKTCRSSSIILETFILLPLGSFHVSNLSLQSMKTRSMGSGWSGGGGGTALISCPILGFGISKVQQHGSAIAI
jgi:hypothetical protein